MNNISGPQVFQVGHLVYNWNNGMCHEKILLEKMGVVLIFDFDLNYFYIPVANVIMFFLRHCCDCAHKLTAMWFCAGQTHLVIKTIMQ